MEDEKTTDTQGQEQIIALLEENNLLRSMVNKLSTSIQLLTDINTNLKYRNKVLYSLLEATEKQQYQVFIIINEFEKQIYCKFIGARD